MHPKFIPIVAAALCFGVAANAVAPFATASFERRIAGTDKTTPIASARLDDYVCLLIRDVSTPDGDHSLRVVIYDGGGREVHQSVRTITAKDGKWGHTMCVGFNPKRDLPGTWWYVAELDDEPLISKELAVASDPMASAG